jgi:hypothetical protein
MPAHCASGVCSRVSTCVRVCDVQGMDFCTVMSLMSILYRGSAIERAQLCVMIFDSDGDFRINQQDLQSALQSLLPISLAQNHEYIVGIASEAFEAVASSAAQADLTLREASPTDVADAAVHRRESESEASVCTPAESGSPSITVQEWGHDEETDDDEFADEQVPPQSALELIALCSHLPQSLTELLRQCGLVSLAPPGCAHAAHCNCSASPSGGRRRSRQQRAAVETLHVKVILCRHSGVRRCISHSGGA